MAAKPPTEIWAVCCANHITSLVLGPESAASIVETNHKPDCVNLKVYKLSCEVVDVLQWLPPQGGRLVPQIDGAVSDSGLPT